MTEQGSAWDSPLPLAWKAALKDCPFCAGLGSSEGRDCLQCEGTGNLFRTYLRSAYRLGIDDGLLRLRSLHRHAESALQGAEGDSVNEASMLLRLGL